MLSLSVIIPTAGRETLLATLASVHQQLRSGDEILVMRLDCHYGNKARDLMMAKATGTHLVFMDDDDVFTEGALDEIREKVGEAPEKIHIFRMRLPSGHLVWGSPVLAESNIGTPMFVIPRENPLGKWDNDGDGASDWWFIRETVSLQDHEPVFHEQVICQVKP